MKAVYVPVSGYLSVLSGEGNPVVALRYDLQQLSQGDFFVWPYAFLDVVL